MYLTDKNGNTHDYDIINTNDRLGIVCNCGHFILDINNNNLYIKDVYVKKEFRKIGIWKALVNEVISIAKENRYKSIISLGQFRRPIATKVWETYANKSKVKNDKSKKFDYYINL